MRLKRLAAAVLTVGCCGFTAASVPAATAEVAASAEALTAEAGSPRFGTSVFRRPGETYRQAFLRVDRTYRGLGAVRVFYSGMPDSWSTIKEDVGDTPVVVSFKAPPSEIVAGLHDREMRQWFARAPTNRVTWWSYYHEPEDDVAKERITSEIYKLAWTHVSALAKSVQNPKLRATLTLMCWTTRPASGRDWRDYYAGDAVIDVLAFDCYNLGQQDGHYTAPSKLFKAPYEVAQSAGKPWGLAEIGSLVVPWDDGRGRAAWLRDVGSYLSSHGASFGTYFDSDVGADFRLHDRPSRRGWRAVVQGQWD